MFKEQNIKNIFLRNRNWFGSKNPLKFHITDNKINSNHNVKRYRRIWPAAKFLMMRYNILENQLPDVKIIMKEHILNIINNIDKQIISNNTPSNHQPSLTNLTDESNTTHIDYSVFKNKLPHTYFYNSANCNKLIDYISNLNLKHKVNVKIEDFISKAALKLIYDNEKLRIVFDNVNNKFLKFKKENDFCVYMKTFDGSNSNFAETEFFYLNPQKMTLVEVQKAKKKVNEYKDTNIPLLRVYNYSEIPNITFLEELIIPPALLTLTIGGISSKLQINEEKSIFVYKSLNYSLTAATNAYEDDVIAQFISDFNNLIENPMLISL